MSSQLMPSYADHLAAKLAGTLEDAVELLRQSAYTPATARLDEQSLDGLLQQCLDLCERQAARPPEPLRLVHQLACTGGTEISRCLSAMPNVHLLSGMNPFNANPAVPPSPAATGHPMRLRGSSRGVSQDLVLALFQAELRLIYANAVRLGQHLVIRDNAQAHFFGATPPSWRPGLRALIPAGIPVQSVIIVREPLDSFLMLGKPADGGFDAQAFDVYRRRALAFVESHVGTPIVRYEDFVANPQACIHSICETLKLPFTDDFRDLASAFLLFDSAARKSGPEAAIGTGRHIEVRAKDEALSSTDARGWRTKLESWGN